MSDHWVEIEFEDSDWPDKQFFCEAPTDSLCHAYFSCDCDEWYWEGIIHGKPVHEGSDDEFHWGEWRQNECRFEDWFYNTDGPLAGRIKVDVKPEWDDGYSFLIGDKDARD